MTVKRVRRTRAELRDLMLTAGKEVLLTVEPTLGFEQLSYSSVFDHLLEHHDQRVTIGSVHERIWASQRDFQLDVLAQALHDLLEAAPSEMLDRTATALAGFDTSTPGGRRHAVRTSIRMGSYQVSEQPMPELIKLAHTVRFRLWSLGTDHPEAEGFAETISEIRRASTDAYVAILRSVMAFLDLRVRNDAGDPEAAIESIAVLTNATGVGLRTDQLAVARTPRLLPSGPNGELEEWFPDAIATWSYVRALLELGGDDLNDDERYL